jgi:P27 family predicted phage terminase small subunit
MPPRIPNNAKRLKGTYRPSRDNRRAPKPAPGAPLPPEWLGPAALPRWAELVEQLEVSRVLTKADRTALGLLADALSEYVAHRATVEQEGATYVKGSRGRSTLKRPRPEVALAREARRDAVRLLEAFGLTPASRNRVEAVAAPEADEHEMFLFGERYFDGTPRVRRNGT